MSLYAHELDIELGLWHMWTRPTCPNNNILLFEFFGSVNLYTTVITETKYLFSNVY